jgi:hypothetical protein
VFPINNIYAFLFSPISTTYSAHLILLHFIILIILGEEYKSRSSLLCSFLQFPITHTADKKMEKRKTLNIL